MSILTSDVRTIRVRLILIGLIGISIYVWCALRAPVVLWSDSEVDMKWARSGEGIWKPPVGSPTGQHVAKAGYLLFLRTAMSAVPWVDETRSAVLVNSILVWLSIAWSSLYFGQRMGWRFGLCLYLLLLTFLRLRDSTSAVMTEAVSMAGFLPLVVLLLFPPRRPWLGPLLTGAASAMLFWIRPNIGMIALLLSIVSIRSVRSLASVAVGFVVLAGSVWIITRPAAGDDAARGLAHTLIAGSAEYYWFPSLGDLPTGTESERAAREYEMTRRNWVDLLGRHDPDARRELVWRSLHGLFGVEYYDAGWSVVYHGLTMASRIASPFVVIAAIGLLCSAPFRTPHRRWNLVAPALILAIVAQNVVFGSLPRYVLPLIPGLLVLAVVASSSLGVRRGGIALVLALAIVFSVILHKNAGALSWEWGKVEGADVVIRQDVPRGILPKTSPATLHVRIATGVFPSGAMLEVSSEGVGPLRTYRRSSGSQVLSVDLPQEVLAKNAAAPIQFLVRSVGSYDANHFMLFPIVPPPWGPCAYRDNSAAISPDTGITAGALDFWAHAGAD